MNYNKPAPLQHYISEFWALVPSVNTLRSQLYSLAFNALSSQYLLTLRKHKIKLLSFTLFSILFLWLIGYSLVPQYVATGVLSIKPASPQAVIHGFVPAELGLLTNKVLAHRVISELKMDRYLRVQERFKPLVADFISPVIGYREMIKEYLGLKRQGLKHQLYLSSPEDNFFDRLVIHRVATAASGSIVEISYSSDNLEDSVLIVNTYMKQYEKLLSDTKNDLYIRRKQSLRQRLLQARVKSHDAEIDFFSYIENSYINNIDEKIVAVDKALQALSFRYINIEQMRVYSESSAVISIDSPLSRGGSRRQGSIENDVVQLENQLLAYEGQSARALELYSRVESDRALYHKLWLSLKEISTLGDTEKGIETTIDRATESTVRRTPNLWFYGIAGLIPGLIFGMLFISIKYVLNKKIVTVEELEALDALYPVLSTLHTIKRSHRKGLALLAVNDVQSTMAKSINSLCTALVAQPQGVPQLMLITSALPGEAKSSLVTNLASVLAKSNKRVLIIDANLRNPVIHKELDIDNEYGLSNYLECEGNGNLPLYKVTGNARLFVIPAGATVENPVVLLASEEMLSLMGKVRGGFDYIIIDGPSVLRVSDSLILSNIVDSIIVTVSAGSTTVHELKNALTYLEKSHAYISGFVMTKVKNPR